MAPVWKYCAAALAVTLVAGTAVALSEGSARPSAKATVAVAPRAALDPGRVEIDRDEVQDAILAGELDHDVKTMLKVDHVMGHGEFVWNERNVPDGPVWIRVDLDKQLISIFRAGHEIGTAVTLYGSNDTVTPQGRFHVQWKKKDHRSATYDNAPMPYTLRLTDDGVAIHGSDVRYGRATHGCIGVPTEFARHLFENMKVGDEVVILS